MSPDLPQQDPAPTWRLDGEEAHLWLADLREPPPAARELLSAAEADRAARFHFNHDRERFITGRALLRTILARYLDASPHDLAFTTGAHGKPALDGAHRSFRFNLSHSENLLLLAVTLDREVGVDLEAMRSDVPFQMLADIHFPPADAAALRHAPEPEKARRFYETWTRTEAQLKASGHGLIHGAQVAEPDRWSLRSFTPAPGFAAALATEGGPVECVGWAWQR